MASFISFSGRIKLPFNISTGLLLLCGLAHAQFVPGTGIRFVGVGDDFEDPSWNFIHNFPKSSANLDGNTRAPLGVGFL